MLRLPHIVIALLFYSAPLLAQELSPAELIALGKDKMARIDSIMTAKGFENKKTNKLPGSTITAYVYTTRSDTGVIQRALQVGWRSRPGVLELEYGVWQKADADKFIGQLLQMRFKKVVRSIKGIVPGETMEMVSYKKATSEISYIEGHDDAETTRYMFSITVQH